jgi:AbiV family abortive infection protein
MDALRKWISAADTIRSSCVNKQEFEVLIQRQRRRLGRFMTEELKSAIRLNIASLFDAAELLSQKKYYGPAIHLMMAAKEECVKWILVNCWDHLDQSTRNKVFSHEFKHKTAGIFYYMSGQLQAIDFAIGGLELLKANEPQISKATAALIDLLPKAIDDPQSIAKTIISSLHLVGSSDETKEVTAKREAALKKMVDDAEKLRTHSIYVDFGQALQISGQPLQFKSDSYNNVKKEEIVARFHIDKLSGLNPSKNVLHSTFPEWKDELEKSLEKLAIKISNINKTND